MNHEIKYFTFLMICARIIKAVRGIFRFPFYSWNASVAQWIEQCPPEACAAVRLRSDAELKKGCPDIFRGILFCAYIRLIFRFMM